MPTSFSEIKVNASRGASKGPLPWESGDGDGPPERVLESPEPPYRDDSGIPRVPASVSEESPRSMGGRPAGTSSAERNKPARLDARPGIGKSPSWSRTGKACRTRRHTIATHPPAATRLRAPAEALLGCSVTDFLPAMSE